MVAGIDFSSIGVRQTIDMPFTSHIDEVDENTTYIGKAPLGNVGNEAVAVWQIQKISKSGTVTTISWAHGDQLFDNIWDNRATTVTYK